MPKGIPLPESTRIKISRALTRPMLPRFWSKVQKGEGCWNWIGGLTAQGYGLFGVTHYDLVLAHRFSYEQIKGKIPEGLTIDHLCRNRKCVNPDHMEPVTNKENILRGQSMSAINARKTHCKNGHPLVEGNLRKYSLIRGVRDCLVCSRYYNRIYSRIRRTRIKNELRQTKET